MQTRPSIHFVNINWVLRNQFNQESIQRFHKISHAHLKTNPKLGQTITDIGLKLKEVEEIMLDTIKVGELQEQMKQKSSSSLANESYISVEDARKRPRHESSVPEQEPASKKLKSQGLVLNQNHKTVTRVFTNKFGLPITLTTQQRKNIKWHSNIC